MTSITHKIDHLLTSVPDYIQKVQCDTNKLTKPFVCAVKTCSNYFEKFDKNINLPYKFHRFPTDKKLRKLWKLKCGLQKHDHVKELMVCSVHFNLDDYIRNYKEEFQNPHFKRQLRSTAIPKLKLGPNQNKQFDVSDTDYDTDIEIHPVAFQYTQNKNKFSENTQIKKSTTNKSPRHQTEFNSLNNKTELDFNEVRQEVDLYNELAETNKSLNTEVIVYENKINAINKSIKTARINAMRLKKLNAAENHIMPIFSKAQINLLLGKKAIWSNDDLATAFTIRHMGSKKCYLYMKNVLKIPLPALSCVQKWAATQAQKDM